MTLKYALLDRDGVINVDRHYVHRVEDFEYVRRSPEAIARLNQAGWTVAVVTNQSGIGRGLYTETDYTRLTKHIETTLATYGARVDGFFHCPHAPDWNQPFGCSCRKPRPGLIQSAAFTLGIDLSKAVLVGDKLSDVQAGRAAGVARCFLVETGHALTSADRNLADGVYRDLYACVDSLLNE